MILLKVLVVLHLKKLHKGFWVVLQWFMIVMVYNNYFKFKTLLNRLIRPLNNPPSI